MDTLCNTLNYTQFIKEHTEKLQINYNEITNLQKIRTKYFFLLWFNFEQKNNNILL